MERVMAGLRAEAAEVQQYIAQMSAVRDACAEAGEFREAQVCQDRIREANIRFAALVRSHAGRSAERERQRLREAHRREELEHKKSWQEKLQQYDADAALLLVQLERQQNLELAEAEAAVQTTGSSSDAGGALAAPHADIAAMEAALETLVRARRFLEADRLKRELAAVRRKYSALIRQQTSRRQEQQLRSTARRLCEQRDAAIFRIEGGRRALLRDRDEGREALRQAHVRAEHDLAVSMEFARTLTARLLTEQLESYTSDPSRGEFFIEALAGRVKRDTASTVALHDDEQLPL